MMKNWMMRPDQKEQMQDDESNIYQNQPQDSLPPFTSDVWNIMQTPASLTDFNQTAQKTTDVALVWGAQNSQPHEMVEPLRQWTEGYNPVSMQEKSWHGYFSHEYGTSGCEMSLSPMIGTTLSTSFRGYSSMKHLGDGGGFGFGKGICGSGSLPMLSNIPDAPIHSSSFLQPMGQLEGFKFNEETGGCGMSIYSRISNTIPAKFDFYAETARGQFGNSGLNDRATGGINSQYPIYETSPYGAVHRSCAPNGTLGGHNHNNYGAVITISNAKTALEHDSFTGKQENYSFVDTGVSGIATGCTGSSFYPTGRTATNNPTHSTAHPTSGPHTSAKHTLVWHRNSTIPITTPAPNISNSISTARIQGANYGSVALAMEHSAARNDLTDGSGINWSLYGAIPQGPLSRRSNNFGMEEVYVLPYSAGTENTNMGNYNVCGSSDNIPTNILPQHTVIPQNSVIVQHYILQYSVDYIMKELSAVPLPPTEGYVVMNDPPLDYDNNWNVKFETELDTDDFILVEPSGDIDSPPKTQQMDDAAQDIYLSRRKGI